MLGTYILHKKTQISSTPAFFEDFETNYKGGLCGSDPNGPTNSYPTHSGSFCGVAVIPCGGIGEWYELYRQTVTPKQTTGHSLWLTATNLSIPAMMRIYHGGTLVASGMANGRGDGYIEFKFSLQLVTAELIVQSESVWWDTDAYEAGIFIDDINIL
jgi:hypothetical protein